MGESSQPYSPHSAAQAASYSGYHQSGYAGYDPYHQPAPSYHQASAYNSYEQPKHNCSVEDVIETAEVCTPGFETQCESVQLPVKRVTRGEYCYDSSSTICTESSETIDNEICTYNYNKKYEEATSKTVEINFKKESNKQMVTVCQPSYGHGYSYGHQYCKEVEQETAYNVPVVEPVDVPVRVGYPEPVKTCVNKPITLPRLSCNTVTEEKCVDQPEVEEYVETIEKCTTKLGAPKCQKIEITLPKQVCIEIVYGYAEDKPEPSYTPDPAYAPEPTYPPEPTYKPEPSYHPSSYTTDPKYPQPTQNYPKRPLA